MVLALHQVWRARRGFVGLDGDLERAATDGATEPQFAHQALDGAPRYDDALSAELPPDLEGAVHAAVTARPDASDLGAQLVVPLSPRRTLARVRAPCLVRVVGRGGDGSVLKTVFLDGMG